MGDATEYREDESMPFLVDDGTATAYVDPHGAEVRLAEQHEVTVEGGAEPPQHIREFVERETDLDPVHDRKRWYREHRIPAGDDVYVAGSADLDGVPEDCDEATVAVVGDGVPRFFVSDETDHGLGDQLLPEAFVSFLAAALLLGAAGWLTFV